MKKYFCGLFLFLAILASCEKEEDLGTFDSIKVSDISNSSAYIFGAAKVEGKVKGVVVGEQPNVTEANGTVYSDEKTEGKNFSFFVSQLYANTKYYFKVFYTDQKGNRIYSPEKQFTTTNFNVTPVFGSLTAVDTIVNQKNSFMVRISLNESGGIRGAEYGICYDKTPNPTIDAKRIVGILDSKGVITCDMSSLNCYDTVMVRPYCKSEKGIHYGKSSKYAKSSWIFAGRFPGKTTNRPASIMYNGRCYIMLGYNPNASLRKDVNDANSDMWSFSSQNNEWTKELVLDGIIKDRTHQVENMKTVPLSNGFMFFKGTYFGFDAYTSFYTYNATTKQYAEFSPSGIDDYINSHSLGCYGFLMNKCPYVAMYAGNCYDKGVHIYKFDEGSKTFSLETSNPKRFGAGNVVNFTIGSQAYIGGGYYIPLFSNFKTEYTKDFWKYDFVTKEWRQLKDLPESEFVASFSFKNRIYAIARGSDNLYEYNVSSDTWNLIEKLPFKTVVAMPFSDALYLFTSHEEAEWYVNKVWKAVGL